MRHDVKIIGDAIRAAVDAALAARLADIQQQIQRGLADVQGVEQRTLNVVMEGRTMGCRRGLAIGDGAEACHAR